MDEKLNDKRHHFVAKPAPHFGVPIILPSSQVTEVRPFSFESRDKEMMERKREKILKALEMEKKGREFKANPMPKLHKPSNPKTKETPQPTKAQPFKLEVSVGKTVETVAVCNVMTALSHNLRRILQLEKRLKSRIQKWQKDLEEEQKKLNEAAKFKAHPAKVLGKQPFIPMKSDRPLVELSNYELHSERRAKERKEFDVKKKQKATELEAIKKEVTGTSMTDYLN